MSRNKWKIKTAETSRVFDDLMDPFKLHVSSKFIGNDFWMRWQQTYVLAALCEDNKWRVFACIGRPRLATPSPEFDTPDECMQWLTIVAAAERSSQ